MPEAIVERKVENLEEILNSKSEETRQNLVSELLKPKIIPKEVIDGRKELTDKAAQKVLLKRYMKDYDLAPYIVRRLESDGIDFRSVGDSSEFKDALYKSIRKEPMKRAFYGQFNAYVPREIMQELQPWVAFYLYAGIWAKKATRKPHKRFFPNTLKNQPVYKIVHSCVMEGIDTIKRVHNQKYEGGQYEHLLKAAPHEREIRSMIPTPVTRHANQALLPYAQLYFPSVVPL